MQSSEARIQASLFALTIALLDGVLAINQPGWACLCVLAPATQRLGHLKPSSSSLNSTEGSDQQLQDFEQLDPGRVAGSVDMSLYRPKMPRAMRIGYMVPTRA